MKQRKEEIIGIGIEIVIITGYLIVLFLLAQIIM